MSKIPSISNLHEVQRLKQSNRIEIFNIVLNKCIEKIVYTNRQTDKTFIIFEVPQVLIGYPSYDIKSCILFLKSKLESESYIVEFIDPFYLYIDWGGHSLGSSKKSFGANITLNPDRLKQQTKMLLRNFPNANKIEYIYEDALKQNKTK
ncbi:hypothetical protein EBU95_02200 [bacterium]|nr:hypothetical protein [bacterium]